MINSVCWLVVRDSLVFFCWSFLCMNILSFRIPAFVIFLSLFLSACSPHPATGVWKATADNKLGIDRLVVSFEGRAEFKTSKLDNADWHCFWAAPDKKQLKFDCTPSTNPDQTRSFVLSVNDKGLAELLGEGSLLATFTRVDENPSLSK